MSNHIRTKILLCVIVLVLVSTYYFQHPKAEVANKELQTRNSYALLMPLVELYTESGSVSGGICDKTKEIHLKIFDEYTKNIKEHELSVSLRPFAFRREKIDTAALKEIPKKIESESDKRAYKVAIENFFADLKQFFDNENILPRIAEPNKKCREEVIDKFTNSHSKTMDYISSIDTSDDSKIDESLAKSEKACLANRKAVACAFLYSYTYEGPFSDADKIDKELLVRFGEDIDRTIHFNRILRDALPADDKRRVLLDNYSHSELRRRNIVQTLIEDDMQKAGRLLLRTMEKAIAESSY